MDRLGCLSLLCWLVTSISCVSLPWTKPRESAWAALDDVEGLSCEGWSQRPKDLAIEEIHPVGAPLAGFFAVTVTRKGRRAVHWRRFDDGSPGAAGPDVPLLRNQQVIGGLMDGTSPRMIVISPSQDWRTEVSVRTYPDNQVVDRTLVQGDVFAARIVRHAAWTGVALSFDQSLDSAQASWEETTADDEPAYETRLLSVTPKLRQVTTVPAAQIDAVSTHDGGWVAFLERGRAAGAAGTMHVRGVGQTSRQLSADLDLQLGLESAAAIAIADDLFVALVDGNSLVGDASLRLMSWTWGGAQLQPRWDRSVSLANQRIGRPVWTVGAAQPELVTLTWVDAEALVTFYGLKNGSPAAMEAYGPLPKGANLLASHTTGDTTALLIRIPIGDGGWRFSVCSPP